MPSHDPRIAQLEDMLEKRLRLSLLTLVLGILVGFIFGAIITMPPLWIGAL
nr:hypothetical protein [Corynebacterium sp. UBA5992]